ncbi:RNA polymerase sigma factor [Rhodopirellula sp. JC639]|uniref:RNA polymerase sigma factor n=1 Tax=Stieleria mannarensis TaxID=2755585 RepID=UPI001C720938|nr:RNA polymerase sigma factor [Rhodopirellula sp. JC639]
MLRSDSTGSGALAMLEYMPSETDSDTTSPRPTSCFETTHWSVVLLAAGRKSTEGEQALAALCQAYWMPLYAYARCRIGDSHRAQDLTQTFFAKLLEKDYLLAADPAKGRFRAFLLTAMKRLMANEWDKRSALKRGGGMVPLSLDFDIADCRFLESSNDSLTAEQIFMRGWVRTLLDRVFEQLRQEFEMAGKAQEFSHLKVFITATDAAVPTSTVAERLGISVGAVRVAVHRLRRRYRQVLREQVAATVDDPEDIDDEIRSLFSAFG